MMSDLPGPIEEAMQKAWMVWASDGPKSAAYMCDVATARARSLVAAAEQRERERCIAIVEQFEPTNVGMVAREALIAALRDTEYPTRTDPEETP